MPLKDAVELPGSGPSTPKDCKMKRPNSASKSSEPSSNLPELAGQLNRQHPLMKLSESIDWSYFEEEFGRALSPAGGRPPIPTRLLVGLHYLKGLYDESDESVVSKWIENPYWQYFCGEETFQHALPCHPTSLVKWRKQVGPDGVEKLLKEVLQVALEQRALKPIEIKRVNVDTTVQEKAIAFPTDARLYDKARRALVKEARKAGIQLRQSYARVGKKALFQHSRYGAARQYRRAKQQTRKLRTYLGRVIRDIDRKASKLSMPLNTLMMRAQQIYRQTKKDSPKLYSVHAPEVECIVKGKVHKRYEFGCKVVLVTTSKTNWIVAADAVHGNPYDGVTLKPAIDQVHRLTGQWPQQAAVDKGFRGSTYHPSTLEVLVAGTRKFTGVLKRLVKRRCAIEPVIGHAKHDHALKRNYLQGKSGDRINALMTACGFNLRKLVRFFLDTPTHLVPVGA